MSNISFTNSKFVYMFLFFFCLYVSIATIRNINLSFIKVKGKAHSKIF